MSAASLKRDRVFLLRCIPDGLVATAAARAFVHANAAVPAREPESRITTELEPYTEEEFLRERGADVESAVYAEMRTARDSLNAFVTSGRGQPVERSKRRPMILALRRLRRALRRPGLDATQSWFGWETLLLACERFALTPALPASAVRLVQDIIVGGLRVPGPTWDANFDEHGSFGGPAPHVPAASAAMYLRANYPSMTSPESIELAARDRFRPARARVAHLLPLLQKDSPTLMWRLAANFARRDRSAGVAHAFASSLGRLIWADPSRGSELLWTTHRRSVKRQWSAARAACESLFLWRALGGDRKADAAVDALLGQRNDRAEDVKKMLYELRSYVRGPDARLRSAAASLFERAARLFAADYDQALSEGLSTNPEVARAVFGNLVELSTELYFASGAYVGADEAESDPSSDLGFFDAIYPALERLRKVGIPAAVHKLLETLEHFVDARPERVYDLFVDLVAAGSTQGFQYEYLGAQAAVKIMEDYLAGHRDVIESSTSRREAFLKTLDAFALWPNAVRIAYRFDEIFR